MLYINSFYLKLRFSFKFPDDHCLVDFCGAEIPKLDAASLMPMMHAFLGMFLTF